MAIRDDDVARLQQAAVIGGEGTRLGTVDGVYYDNATDQPAWAAVQSGARVCLVPLAMASLQGAELHVPFGREQLENAPHHDPGRALSPQDEIDLFRHYGVEYDDQTASAPATDAGPASDDAMTRSEEHLRVRTESEPVERVRLRKHVVTEYQRVTVPVSHEEVTLEREPVTDANIGNATSGPDLSDEEHEVVLNEERVTVDKTTEPVERVRLGTETVTEQESVTEEVRKEHIETDGDVNDRR